MFSKSALPLYEQRTTCLCSVLDWTMCEHICYDCSLSPYKCSLLLSGIHEPTIYVKQYWWVHFTNISFSEYFVLLGSDTTSHTLRCVPSQTTHILPHLIPVLAIFMALWSLTEGWFLSLDRSPWGGQHWHCTVTDKAGRISAVIMLCQLYFSHPFPMLPVMLIFPLPVTGGD